MGLTLVVYDGRGRERFRSPLLVTVAGTPRSTALVAARPCPEGFTAHSYAVLDDAGDVISTGTFGRPIDGGDTLNIIESTS